MPIEQTRPVFALAFNELAHFDVPDSEILCSIRYGGEVFVGVRVGGVEADRHSWIYGRYQEHKLKRYEGWWAMNGMPMQALPLGLKLDGCEWRDGICVVESGEGQKLRFGSSRRFEVNGNLSFEIKGWRADDGVETVNVTTVQFVAGGAGAPDVKDDIAITLPDLPVGSSTLWVRIVAQRVYSGLPPDYQAKTGRSPNDPNLEWRDDATGRRYKFDELHGVGAVPYSLRHPKRVRYEQNKLDGTIVKHPEWTDWLIELDINGAEKLLATEWAMIRLLVLDEGEGEWIGETAVSPGAAVAPSLMRLEAGELVPQALRCSMRSVGALKEIDGNLFVGAMDAGRDGRYAALIETELVANDQEPALAYIDIVNRFCECALLNETIHSIARLRDTEGGRIFAVSSCELFERVADALGKRLVGHEPGGRSLTVCHPTSGRHWMVRAVENDFAETKRWWPATNYLITEGPDGSYVGPGVSALYNSVLWEWSGRVWGIADCDPVLWDEALRAGEKPLTKVTSPEHLDIPDLTQASATPLADKARQYQSLCWFDGSGWHKVVRWPKHRYWMTRGGACGPQMILFGTRGSDGTPSAMRFDGTKLESNIEFPYFVERADTTLSANGKREILLLSCLKADPDPDPGADGNDVLPGHYLVEIDGTDVRKTVVFPCVHRG